jgi:hypothetical protein
MTLASSAEKRLDGGLHTVHLAAFNMKTLEQAKDERIELQDKLIKVYEERIEGLEQHIEMLEKRLKK